MSFVRESVHLQRFAVPFEYPVHFTNDVFSPENPALLDALTAREPGRRHRVLAVVDRGVVGAMPEIVPAIERYIERHRAALEMAAPPIVVEGGEGIKNDPHIVPSLHARFDELGLDRHAFVLLVGGGAVLDMGGYAAATAHRGIRVVRVPTTVLAQNDSGVGVKNGINAFGKKNFLGTFAPPYAVLNDARFLATLSRRDRIAGMAEAVKVALIRDAAFFAWIGENAAALREGEAEPMSWLVRRAAELHLEHIARGGDPFEHGSARPLDFGHWSAHKLESLTQHRLRHGEAVAIGIALDALYSAKTGRCDPAVAEQVVEALRALGFRLWDDALALPGPRGLPLVLDGLAEFREHLGGDLTLTLLAGVGQGVSVRVVDEAVMTGCLDALRDRDAELRGATDPGRLAA